MSGATGWPVSFAEGTPRPCEGLRGRTVVVGLDRGGAARAVAGIARSLAEDYGSVPCVVRALDAGNAGHAGSIAPHRSAELFGDEEHEPHRRAVRAELHLLLHERVPWPVHVHPGAPADVIVREAAEREAVMIVMGIRRHGAAGQALRDEATLNVVRMADCTVLGVAPTLDGRPRRAVVGIDFTAPAAAAAQMALKLMAPGGTLVLVHLGPAADDAFDRLFDALNVPPGFSVVREQADASGAGGVAAGLLAAADRHHADLVAVGSRRQPWTGEAAEASVSTALVRAGRISVLVVPPAPNRFAHDLDFPPPPGSRGEHDA